MAQEEFITVEVLNWKKYNPRSDVKNPSWFRLEHSILEDDDFYSFSHAELIAFIYILSQASKKLGAPARINFDRAEKLARLDRATLTSAVAKLTSLGILTVHDTDTLRTRNAADTHTGPTERNGTGRDGTEPAAPNAPAATPPTPEALTRCREAWRGTLEAFDQPRNLVPDEERMIYDAIQKHGEDAVELALFGAAFEPAFDGWKPADAVNIARVLLPDKKTREPRIQKFVGYGVRERTRQLKAEVAERGRVEAELARFGPSEPNPEAEARAREIRERIQSLARFGTWSPIEEAS